MLNLPGNLGYRMGKPRAVPYKGEGAHYDEGWLDGLCCERRGYDEWEEMLEADQLAVYLSNSEN